MVDPNTRNAKRTPVTLKIKFKSETLEQFIERYAVDVSQGGIFIRTKDPLAVGTQMKFEFQLKDGSSLIGGEGTVVWTRENDPSRPAIAPGMGVRFDKLADGSQAVLERILADKQKAQPQRPQAETTKPPLFTDTPTRVAPAPVAEALLGQRSRGGPSQPMPFHSDADDFDERAFDEQTKVRSLEELAAQTASGDDELLPDPKSATVIIPADELAMRRAQARADSTIAEPPEPRTVKPPPERPDPTEARTAVAKPPKAPAPPTPPVDEADGSGLGAEPFVPAAPAAKTPSRATPTPSTPPRLLDTTPSPRNEPVTSGLAAPASAGESARTRASASSPRGPIPARSRRSRWERRAPASRRSSAPRPTRAISRKGVKDARRRKEETVVEPMPVKQPSSAPIIIAILAVVAAVCAGVWFFVLRDQVDTGDNASNDKPDKHGSAAGRALPHDSPGSAMVGSGAPMPGSSEAVATVGSGAGGSGAKPTTVIDTPAAAKVATVVAVTAAHGAVVTVGDQSGPAPFTAQLENGKSYVAHVTAPGFVAIDVPVVGGTAPAPAKLSSKLHLLTVTSEPAGAQIGIDGVAVGKVTPADVDLKAYAGKTKLRVALRKSGYRPVDTVVDLTGATESDDKVAMTMPNVSLVVAPVYVAPRPHPPQTGSAATGSDSGGPVTTPPDTGSAATTTPTPTNDTPKPPDQGDPDANAATERG